MSLWADFAPLLAKGESLTYDQSREMMALIMAGELDEVKLSSYLSIMAVRGINVRELRGLADQMQASAKHIDLPGRVVDIVGTGGDKANTVRIIRIGLEKLNIAAHFDTNSVCFISNL